MDKVYSSIEELIGNTPLVEMRNIEKEFSLKAHLLAKLEFMNPAGSSKDRVALSMINEAEKAGIINKESVIIEPTSGNTGIGLCAVAASRGYKCIIIMPDTMSMERRLVMSAYGAELILTDGALGMTGCINKANELAASMPNAFVAGQFVNPANPKAHYDSTGPEIWRDTDGNVDIFVAGIGTGGTITGTGKYLKEQKASVKIVGVEPATSAVLSGKPAGKHGLQGIGAGFVPEVLDTSIYDEIIPVTDQDAYNMGRLLARREGALVGITSGAALYAAIELAKRPENEGKTIVALLPDTGNRYLTTPMFSE